MKTRLFVMLMALFVLSNNNRVNAQEYHYDVNNDGDVNITDVMVLVNYILCLDNGNYSDIICPDSNHPHMIDLGLPNGTKWACCNVDATKPEGDGGYYQWGEIVEKTEYNWGNYIHCDGSMYTCHNLGNDISGTEYDVAHVKWGGNWCMPSVDDYQELLDNCTSEWTTINDMNGRKFISNVNGASIFLPAAGYHHGNLFDYHNEGGLYGVSTQWSSDYYGAYYFRFDSDSVSIQKNIDVRDDGLCVRPIIR